METPRERNERRLYWSSEKRLEARRKCRAGLILSQEYPGEEKKVILPALSNAWTALHMAVQQGRLDDVRWLVEKNRLLIDQQDSNGYTALHLALQDESRESIANYLCMKGADFTLRSREQLNCFEMCIAVGHFGLGARVLQANFNVDSILTMFAKRYFLNYFAGDPQTHHYTRDYLLYAYVKVMCRRFWLFQKSTKLNLLERFFIKNCQGFFSEFSPKRRSRWQEKANKWQLFRNGFEISKYVFAGGMMEDEVNQGIARGLELFDKWKSRNKKLLRNEETQRLITVSDAIRLRQLMEQQEIKTEIDQPVVTVDLDACVHFDKSLLEYNVDTALCTEYTICLGTKPKGTVVLKLAVNSVKNNNKLFIISPTIKTFTPRNWNKPFAIRVSVVDDDAIVRLKRMSAQGENCDHLITHTVISSTDLSYKYKDLKWYPEGNSICVHVLKSFN